MLLLSRFSVAEKIEDDRGNVRAFLALLHTLIMMILLHTLIMMMMMVLQTLILMIMMMLHTH